MIEEVLEQAAPAVAAEEAFEGLCGAAGLPGCPAAPVRAGQRRRELRTARSCARGALGRLGVAAGPVPVSVDGGSRWPPSVVGSITRCTGYRAAAVARVRDVITIGIDAEPNEPMPRDVLELIALPAERASLRGLAAAMPGPCWDRLLFSAKESVYKAWFSLTHSYLGFAEAAVTIEPCTASFAAQLLVPGPVVAGRQLGGFTGRWLVRDGLILTGIVIPTAA